MYIGHDMGNKVKLISKSVEQQRCPVFTTRIAIKLSIFKQMRQNLILFKCLQEGINLGHKLQHHPRQC